MDFYLDYIFQENICLFGCRVASASWKRIYFSLKQLLPIFLFTDDMYLFTIIIFQNQFNKNGMLDSLLNYFSEIQVKWKFIFFKALSHIISSSSQYGRCLQMNNSIQLFCKRINVISCYLQEIGSVVLEVSFHKV